MVLSTFKSYTLIFRLAKSVFDARVDVSMPISPFKSAFVAYLDRSYSTFTFPPEPPYCLGKY